MRFRIFTLLGGISLVGMSLSACGDSDDKKVTVRPTIASLTNAICDVLFRCCNRGEINYILGPYVDLATCGERLVRATERQSGATINLRDLGGPAIIVPNVGALSRAVREGRSALDGANVGACINLLNTQACNVPEPEQEEQDPFCAPLPEDPPPSPCDPDLLMRGRLGVGGKCSSTESVTCLEDGPDPDDDPDCKLLPSLECQPGLICRRNSQLGVFGQCVLPSRIGEPCFADTECERELYCSHLDGTCQAFRELGQSCVFSDDESPNPPAETQLTFCKEGLHCDPISDTCVEACQRGAACTIDEQCDEDAMLTCIMGRCDVLRSSGLPCAAADDCADGLTCIPDPFEPINGICSSKLADGEDCLGHTECVSGFCDPSLFQCAPQVEPGLPCPAGMDEQCAGGACFDDVATCVSDADCSSPRTCDTALGTCRAMCVELRPEGATCTLDNECDSENCIVGFCRTPPLMTGVACDADLQCESEFCGLETERVCTELPLALGAACITSDQCDSLVCFSATGIDRECISGLEEGQPCGDFDQAPCNPKKYYCNDDDEPALCAPLLESGEECEESVECRSKTCDVRFGRLMCTMAAPPDAAICDQGDPLPMPGTGQGGQSSL